MSDFRRLVRNDSSNETFFIKGAYNNIVSCCKYSVSEELEVVDGAIKMKKIKPEVLVVGAVFAILAVYGLGLSLRNIASTLAYNNPQSGGAESAQSADSTPGRPASSGSSENPIKRVRAIAGDYVQINDNERWYRVGDMVEGGARIVAIEQTRILVEWNGRQGYVPFDFSSIAESRQQAIEQPEEDSSQLGDWANSLTQEQQAQLQQRVMSVMQNWENLSAEDQARMEQMGQRFQNMSEQERQQMMQRLGPQIQQWLQSDQRELPQFSLD